MQLESTRIYVGLMGHGDSEVGKQGLGGWGGSLPENQGFNAWIVAERSGEKKRDVSEKEGEEIFS